MSTTPNLGLKTRSSSENEGNFIDYRLEISGTSPTSNMMIIDDVVGGHISSKNNPHNVSKVDVGLGSVNNTSDANKPVSTAQQTAINSATSTKQDRTNSLTTESVLSDGDSIPFFDVSAAAHRKTLWSNVKAKLKTYFDALYAEVVHSHTKSQITDFPSSMPPTAHSHVATDLPSATTAARGVVQLSSATNSTSATLAATASAVKAAYDLANGTASELGSVSRGITNYRKVNSFDDIPVQPGFLAISVEYNGIPDSSSPYPTAPTQWWSVIQSGSLTRLTQIATQCFTGMYGHNETWTRTKHDATWSDWVKCLNTNGEGKDYTGIDPNNAGKIKPERASAGTNFVSVNTTLGLVNSGRLLFINSSNALTITIPANSSVAFPLHTEIEIEKHGTGTVTIAPASGVSIACPETSRTISSRYASVCLKKYGENSWLLQGALG